MSVIGLIPLRSGSKRLPNKNKLLFEGKKLYEYTLEAALDSKLDSIIISTDYEDLLKKKFPDKVKLHSRSKKTASDSSSLISVVKELLKDKYLMPNDVLCLLYATAPMRGKDIINNLIEKYNESKKGSAIAVTEFNQPFHQALKPCTINKNFLKPVFPELINNRKEKSGKFFVGDASTYISGVDTILKNNSFYSEPIRYVEIELRNSQDIDTPDDLMMLKQKWQKK